MVNRMSDYESISKKEPSIIVGEFVRIVERHWFERPYYGIEYIENGELQSGYGSYSLDVISDYLKKYFGVNRPRESEWIPCTPETMPEEGIEVLCCFYNGENTKIIVSRRSDYNYWSGVGRTADMVAWMPLPEPYEPKGENQ